MADGDDENDEEAIDGVVLGHRRTGRRTDVMPNAENGGNRKGVRIARVHEKKHFFGQFDQEETIKRVTNTLWR